MKFRRYTRMIIVFSMFILVMLMAQRLVALAGFGDWQELQNSRQYLAAFLLRAIRFDLKYLASLLLVFVWLPLLLVFLPQGWLQRYLGFILRFLLLLTAYILFVDIGYLFYFQKPIDVLIFGFLQDDTSAILALMLDNLLLVLLFIAFIAFAALLLNLFSRLGKTQKVAQPEREFMPWLLSLLVLVVLARGSLDTFPLQRKHASVSDNRFINSLVMNSPFNLYYAWKDYRVNNQKIFQQDLLKRYGLEDFQQLLSKAGYDQQHPLLRRSAFNARLEKLKPHVVFVQMEGWSAYIARKHSNTNNVLGEFAQHAQSDHFYTQVFSNKYATNPTIENLLLNSPITPLSQSVASQTRFRLFNVQPFIDKGYRSLFLSGGYSSWRNHNRFWLTQGFDEYIGRSTIENTFQIDASDNPWGVYDEYVFRYLEQSLTAAEAQGDSLFSFVLTTNNHPPVRLPEDFKMPPLQPEIYGFAADDEEKKQILSGYYYQSDQLGRFISWVKNGPLKDKMIIVATGDHPLRQFSKSSSLKDQYVRYAVASYIYVPESIDRLAAVPNEIATSHIDLFPTLFELSLSGADYYNFGTPLTDKTVEKAYGWSSRGKFLFREGVADEKERQLYPWQDSERMMLKTDSRDVSDWQWADMDQEAYRKILKQYLLVEDYQQQLKSGHRIKDKIAR